MVLLFMSLSFLLMALLLFFMLKQYFILLRNLAALTVTGFFYA